jgi:hypothetical protein
MINNDCNHKLCQLLKSPKVKLVKILNKPIITCLIVAVLDTIHTSDLCELLQALKFVGIKQPGVGLSDKIAMLMLVVGAASS